MKKFIAFYIMVSAAFPVFAADESAVISLFEGTPAAEKTQKAEPEEDDGGIFSFLNFKSKKKEKPSLNVADEKRLSPEEQTLKLADEGDVNAQLAAGYLYLYGGNGIEADYEKAFKYYAKAAVQNNNIGLNNLGSLYYSGIGVDKNTAKAAVLFDKAAKLGNAEAAVNLAFLLLTGNGVEKNPKEAMKWFEKAAEDKNSTAQFMAGYARYTGRILETDPRRTVPLIKAAAEAKFDEAQYVLAQMYINGTGLPQNYGNAVKYLKKAVAQGHVESMMLLGDIWQRGEKSAKNLYWAHIMFNLASVHGNPDAAERRNAIESKLKMEELLQAQTEAERFKDNPSELTTYIRQTFGSNVRSYIDSIK